MDCRRLGCHCPTDVPTGGESNPAKGNLNDSLSPPSTCITSVPFNTSARFKANIVLINPMTKLLATLKKRQVMV